MICQELLTRNKTASAEFLEANYDKFFSHYQNLLNSDNYVTRRQALKVTCFLSRYNSFFSYNYCRHKSHACSVQKDISVLIIGSYEVVADELTGF